MKLRSLHVAHESKSRAKQLTQPVVALGAGSFAGSFHLDTCQRKIWVYSRELPNPAPAQVEILSGIDAYRFLLRVACGLESMVQGETDIFGQIKEAWKRFESANRFTSRELSQWMQKLFEDTKDIRALHLQNVGGSSYGTLVRMLLRQHGITPSDSILISGAGQIAQSICPYLLENPLRLHNRTFHAAEELARQLQEKSPHPVTILSDEEFEREWKTARFAVICTPLNAELDPGRVATWSGQCVIHLGAMRDQAGVWSQIPGFCSLNELFSLQSVQDQARLRHIQRASRACDERSILRSLASSAGASVSLAHGWEDLAEFA